ncbi:MAG TPA: hypothetical protein VGI47_07590 [Candidatus Binataceae bacterium]
MEPPLARVAMIGARIHDGMMRKDIDMGVASRVHDPIRALEIPGSRSDIEYRHGSLSLPRPRLPGGGLFHFEATAGRVLEIPAAPIPRTQLPFSAKR